MRRVKSRSASLRRTLQTGLGWTDQSNYLLTLSCRKCFVRLFQNPDTRQKNKKARNGWSGPLGETTVPRGTGTGQTVCPPGLVVNQLHRASSNGSTYRTLWQRVLDRECDRGRYRNETYASSRWRSALA
jgi:hypothetical protein